MLTVVAAFGDSEDACYCPYDDELCIQYRAQYQYVSGPVQCFCGTTYLGFCQSGYSPVCWGCIGSSPNIYCQAQ
jgi:hypothetical protein